MEEAKWYVAHTFSGYENKVKSMNAIRNSDFICYSKLK